MQWQHFVGFGSYREQKQLRKNRYSRSQHYTCHKTCDSEKNIRLRPMCYARTLRDFIAIRNRRRGCVELTLDSEPSSILLSAKKRYLQACLPEVIQLRRSHISRQRLKFPPVRNFTPCLRKKQAKSFCHNYIKLSPNLMIFGTMMENSPKLYEVHSFTTSPNSRQSITVLNADVPNCYCITLQL